MSFGTCRGRARARPLNNQGGNPDGSTDGMGGTGDAGQLSRSTTRSGIRAAARSTSQSRPTRLLFDARTPTAWGEVKAYIEMDFAHANENVVENTTTRRHQRLGPALAQGVTGRWAGCWSARRPAYSTIPTPTPSCSISAAKRRPPGGRARRRSNTPIRVPTARCLRPGSENPVPEDADPFGQIDIDTHAGADHRPVLGDRQYRGQPLPATTACIRAPRFSDRCKSILARSWIATARINQPWGHLQIGAVMRDDQLNDGQYLNQSFVGYGGTISGDVHPFSGTPGPLGKDDLGFGFGRQRHSAGQFANGAGLRRRISARRINVPGFGFVNPLAQTARGNAAHHRGWNSRGARTVNRVNVRQAYDRLVRVAGRPTAIAPGSGTSIGGPRTCARRSRRAGSYEQRKHEPDGPGQRQQVADA